MKDGWVVICPACFAKIDDFELSGEWFCECGEQGILDDIIDEEDLDDE
jgi:hypothetical protein